MQTPKRFYRAAKAEAAPDGHAIRLDDRLLKSPGGNPFLLPTAALADAIAEEWRSQGERIVPASMPLMQLAATAIDRVGPALAETVAGIGSYATTDLLCYRAEAPAALVDRQQRLWQPLLDWAALHLDASFRVTAGVVPLDQPPATLAAVHTALGALDPFRLVALSVLTQATGSAVLAMALQAGRIDAETAFELSQLDETFQIERWGEDAEAMRRRALVKSDIAAAGRFLSLLET
jgi:chaperone required for assembly of F1-ATPase